MTRNRQTTRATLLAVVMVASVALTGVSAGETTTTASVQDAVEYGGKIELALGSGESVSLSASEVTVWVEGAKTSITVEKDGSNGRVVLGGLEDVAPHESLTVNVDAGKLDTDNVSVTVTGSVLEAGREGNFFKGADVAYVGSAKDVTFDIFRGNQYVVRRSTGTNSKVYVIDTDGANIGPSYFVNETEGAKVTTEYHIRDLGLTASVNRTDVPGSGSVEVSMSSNGADRPMLVRLVDASSGDVVRTKEGRIGGDGTGSVALHDLSKGTYRIVVEDSITGITTETAKITVGATEEGTVEFASKVITEQRGDVAEIPLSFQGSASGGTATVTLGSEDLNFKVQFTVVDDDGDGRAMVHWNIAESAASDAGISVSGGSIEGSVDVMIAVDEPVTPGEYPLSVSYDGQETSVATALVESRSTEDLAVWTAPASVSGFDSVADLRSAATQDRTVAIDPLTRNDDWIVLELSASGLEGYVDGVGDLDGSHGFSFRVVESDETVGPNAEPLTVEVSDARLLADADNDTYYVFFQPDELVFAAEPGDKFVANFTVSGTNSATTSTQRVTASFTFVNGTATFDTTDGTVVVSPEEDATVTGTSTFAPGTELTVVLRSSGGRSPFIKTLDGVTVQADGTWSATVDLSGKPAGQSFTARVKKAGKIRSTAEGEIRSGGATATSTGDGDATDEATPTDTGTTQTTATAEGTPTPGDGATDGATPTPTPTATSSPGFGAAVAVLAVLGAALLGRRN